MGLRNALRRFRKDSRGTISAEAIVALPLLIWTHLATYEYFDAFSIITRNEKATYTLADMISRQTGTVTPTFIDWMLSLYDYLNHQPANSWVRVTTIGWDPNAGSSGQYYVMWSYATNNGVLLDDTTLQSYTARLPTIATGDSLIMVETSMTYTPAFQLAVLPTGDLQQLVVTRPRISPQVAWSNS